jgi:hypothetical protein
MAPQPHAPPSNGSVDTVHNRLVETVLFQPGSLILRCDVAYFTKVNFRFLFNGLHNYDMLVLVVLTVK